MVYKLSLAAADLLTGVFVLPSFTYALHIIRIAPLERRTNIAVDFSNYSHDSSLRDSYGKLEPLANDYYLPFLNNDYGAVFGLFTAISFMVSVSTLMFASYDRFRAISAPLTYDKTNATTGAKRATIVLWIIAIILGLLPLFVSELGNYRILAGGGLFAVNGEAGLVLHLLALGIPFIIVWILTVSLKVISKRQARLRKKLMSKRQTRESKTEERLTKTLSIMVGIFTLCVLPAILFIAIPKALPTIKTENITILAKEPARAFKSLEIAATIILASNSLWNCFIYSFRNKEFRRDAAVIYFKIFSFLGLVRVKNAVGSCIHRIAHNGGRRISTIFSPTGPPDPCKKNSATSEETIFSAMTTSTYQGNMPNTKGISDMSAGTSGLGNYV